MTLEDKIIDWFHRRKVLLSQHNAKTLIKMVREHKDGVLVAKYQWMIDRYELIQTFKVNDITVKEVLDKNLPDIKGFTLFKIHDENNEVVKEIYTINSTLFKSHL